MGTGSAKILKKDVAYVGRLARLNIREEEIETFTLQLNGILSYMDKLNGLDTSGIRPMSHVIEVSNAFREDMVRESFPQDVSLSNAPEREKEYFKVPRIIED